MWGLQTTDDITKLNGPTEIFDACGAYDIHKGGAAISKGSNFEKWQDALSFLEWYGIPHMDGFGIIIIDNREGSQDKYFSITGSTTEAEKCFEKAAKIATSLLCSLLVFTYSVFY